ncbi:MerR family transcriptional regulator [Donghicola sp. XS_ASV15]|uniref:MerR family transcriptional regulator n=1 Tax=Donghicola sp. XS_ASV15 TaxID=3241295 RepID=UPI003517CCAF
MARKSPDAFRTISEVADWLETPAHVLRFWESKFTQVKPVKRAGGRRYYRPADMELLGGIKKLLHDEGMTIKGVQKILREQGVKHVAGLSDAITPPDTKSVTVETESAPAAPKSEQSLPEQAPLPPLPKTEKREPPSESEDGYQQGNLFGDDFEDTSEVELLEVEVEDAHAPAPAEVIPLRPATQPASAEAAQDAETAREPAPRLLAMALQTPEKQRPAIAALAPQIRSLHERLSQAK